MTSIKPTTVPTKRLAASITAASTVFSLNDIKGWDGNDLTSADFGTVGYGVFRDSTNTIMEIFEFDPSTIASSSITINRRGLKFTGDLTTEVTANKLTWIRNETLVELGTDVPQLLANYVDVIADQTIAGVKTFSSSPKSSVAAATSTELVRKAELDLAALGSITNAPLVVPATAGDTVTVDQLVYLKLSDQEWYPCDADTAGTVENIILGITRGAGTDGNSITNGVTMFGEHEAASAIFTVGEVFASNTAGGFSSSAGTKEVSVGVATSTTKITFNPRFDQQITEDIQDALVGTSGTPPSSANKFVDDADTTGTGSVVRLSALSSYITDGGTGADGALAVTTGTTTLDLGNAAVYVKNYSSISITGDGSLAFSNPASGGTIIVLRCTGDVTLTSSAAPMIDASGMGSAGGAGGTASSGGNAVGTAGTTPQRFLFGNGAGGGGQVGGGGSAGATGASATFAALPNDMFRKYPNIFMGAGGGGGAASNASGGASVSGGAGGRGGGALIIDCAGAWNFTTTAGISVAGKNGSNGTNTVTGANAQGGGAGSGGCCFVTYGSLTANTGTITVSAGSGGTGVATGSSGGAYVAMGSGGGGGSATGAGTAGTSNTSATTGGAAATGSSAVVQNDIYY